MIDLQFPVIFDATKEADSKPSVEQVPHAAWQTFWTTVTPCTG